MIKSPRFRFAEESPMSFRSKVLRLFLDEDISPEDAEMALCQVLNHIRDMRNLLRVLKEMKLKPCDMKWSEILEFIVAIERSGSAVAYISRGWKDPGFRMFNTIEIPPEKLASFRAYANEFMDVCATQLISVAGHDKLNGNKQYYELELAVPIYADNLTRKTLEDALDALETVTGKIYQLLKE